MRSVTREISIHEQTLVNWKRRTLHGAVITIAHTYPLSINQLF